jgi:hypothetical protein
MDMTQDSKENREKKFRQEKGKQNPNIIVSTNGLRTVLKTPSAGKKPYQRRRKRAEKSRTTSAKRILLTGNHELDRYYVHPSSCTHKQNGKHDTRF